MAKRNPNRSRKPVGSWLARLAIGVVFLAAGAASQAHHSSSVYDRENHITLHGVVTEYLFASPHVRIYFETKNKDGHLEKWTALSAPPQRLYRSGWSVKSLKAGDKITVTGAPRKDGTHILSVRRLVGPTGLVLNEGAE